jgi:heavy metal sensor kinase
MSSSVRIRLTLWYTAAMAVVLVILAAATYLILRQSSARRTDASVSELAESFLSTVQAEARDDSASNVKDTIKDDVLAAIQEHRFRDTIYVVLSEPAPGQSASSQPANLIASSDDEPLSREAALQLSTRVHQRPDRAFANIHFKGQKYRGYSKPFSVAGANFRLVVLQSLHDQQQFLESVIEAFALIIPLALILAGTGGYFLARRSLSPVVAMSAQAGRISSENLHQRLEVRNATDELGRLAASFNALLDRLDHSFEQQRRFVADASHELRTPVAILCGEAEVTLAQPHRTTEEYKASLDVLRGEAKRLKHIVEDLFTLARADAGQHPPTLTNFYLDELLVECARRMQSLAAARQITLHAAPSAESPVELPICADESLLRRMFMNLLDNAVKYTPKGGSIFLSCFAGSNGEYRVTVRDTGPGIEPGIQNRIFERFFRADPARSRAESDGSGGAGLGLSISRWIAEIHGGSLDLAHSDQTGSTFTVTLPATAVPAASAPLIQRLSAAR